MRMRIVPYNAASRSALAIANALGALRLRLVRTRFRPRRGDYLVNWGCSDPTVFPDGGTIINDPEKVGIAGNKLLSSQVMKDAGVTVPEFTTSLDEALKWYDDGLVVVQRNLLRANSGRGIVICDPEYPCSEGGEMPHAEGRMWTKYIKKYDEYRVHVFNGEVIDVQQKMRRRDYEREIDSRVRNAAGGWVFCRGGIDPPRCVLDEGRAACLSLGLDFGACDVGYTRYSDTATVYEVNTAPGVEGSTVSTYAAAIREFAAAGGEVGAYASYR